MFPGDVIKSEISIIQNLVCFNFPAVSYTFGFVQILQIGFLSCNHGSLKWYYKNNV